jgi:hypothetical protein
MTTTFNQALKVLNNGNEHYAWEIAKKDDSLEPSITKEQWLSFAKNALIRRNKEAVLSMHRINQD